MEKGRALGCPEAGLTAVGFVKTEDKGKRC